MYPWYKKKPKKRRGCPREFLTGSTKGAGGDGQFQRDGKCLARREGKDIYIPTDLLNSKKELPFGKIRPGLHQTQKRTCRITEREGYCRGEQGVRKRGRMSSRNPGESGPKTPDLPTRNHFESAF